MIVVTFEVIAHRVEELGASQPNKHGRKLWNLFFSAYNGRICLLVNDVAKHQHQLVMEWLKRENFKPGSIDFHWEKGSENRLDRVRALHATHTNIDWYIDTDPEAVAKVIKDGIPTLLVSVPFTIRPEWEEPRTIIAWDKLSNELENQALKKAEREWTE